jgi:IS30 family transposase
VVVVPHGVLVAREVRGEFWSLVRWGMSPAQAGVAVGASGDAGNKWFRDAGGVKPTLVKPGPRTRRPLRLQDRESIALMRAGGAGVREIADAIGRDPGVVSRELGRNTTKAGLYRPLGAQQAAEVRARRPKTAKLATPGPLREFVIEKLGEDWSPRQIANVLAVEHPEEPEQRVCAETIYQSIYVQSRGALKRDLAAHLRRGRTQRKPQNRPQERRGKLVGTISISERPAEAEDRAVPGHWEGDLIMGRENGSAIGTLVERSTRFVLLIHLPGRHTAQAFHDAVVPTLNTLPVELKRSLTWDNGKEMAMHHQITMATDMAVYFADPRSPWQRGSNENTNGLLRQYFPKGVSLRQYGPTDLIEAARRLNTRPRETLAWRTPAEVLNELLSEPFKMPGVA